LQRGNVKVAIVRTFLMQCAPDLLSDGRGEHVQDFVAVVAQREQPRRRFPCLWRFVVPQLRRDDLMHRKMQTGIDRLAFNFNVTATFSQRAFELGVLVSDHERPHVGVCEIRNRQIELGERIGVADKSQSFVSVATGRSGRHGRSVSEFRWDGNEVAAAEANAALSVDASADGIRPSNGSPRLDIQAFSEGPTSDLRFPTYGL